jgi:hypothetical protein
MRPEHPSNTQPRLLRKTVLGDTVAAIAQRRTTAAAGEPAKGEAGQPGEEKRRAAGGTGAAREPNSGAGSGTVGRAGGGKTAGTAGLRSRSAAPARQRSRFVGPAHLDGARKAEIAAALEANGIGDEVGRQIFIGALEYQLSAFGSGLQRHGARPAEPVAKAPRDQALTAIREQTRALAEGLRLLNARSRRGMLEALTEQDRLGRGYDERYLSQLSCELERLDQACAAAGDPVEATPPQDPAPSRGLVVKLAAVYAECFEEEPSAETGGRFQKLLEILDAKTGVVIGHDAAFLEGILDG